MSDRNADIRARRAAGETLESIGERYGLTKQRVGQLTRGVRPAVDTTRRHKHHDAILAALRGGSFVADVAERFGVSRQTVANISHRCGIRNGCPIGAKVAALATALDALGPAPPHGSKARVCREVGVSPQLVFTLKRRFGARYVGFTRRDGVVCRGRGGRRRS